MTDVRVKVCGVTSVDDALMCIDAGVDAIGINTWAGSPRRCELAAARHIAAAVGDGVELVGVFVDSDLETIRCFRDDTGISWVQLHGDEPPEMLEALLPYAFKALHVRGPSIEADARVYPGEHLLLDAAVPGMPGGTGRTFDWTLASRLATERLLTLAGGLNPENVARAVSKVRPYRVDVASGVESAPGRKDPARVRAFVENARSARLER